MDSVQTSLNKLDQYQPKHVEDVSWEGPMRWHFAISRPSSKDSERRADLAGSCPKAAAAACVLLSESCQLAPSLSSVQACNRVARRRFFGSIGQRHFRASLVDEEAAASCACDRPRRRSQRLGSRSKNRARPALLPYSSSGRLRLSRRRQASALMRWWHLSPWVASVSFPRPDRQYARPPQGRSRRSSC